MGRVLFKDDKSAIAGLSYAGPSARVMFQQLGPTFVKFGQMVSSRAEALPKEWQTGIGKVAEQCATVPWR